MIKFTLTALLIQFPVLLIHTTAIATPQILLATELSNTVSEDDVVPPKVVILPYDNVEDDVVPARSF
ncbi:MAG: hypothetical protein WBA13_22210 [Microcoleaceae cyanobacterium]